MRVAAAVGGMAFLVAVSTAVERTEVTTVEAFRAECAAKAKAAEAAGQFVVAGKDGWLFLPTELRHVGAGLFWGEHAAKVSRAEKPEHADPLPAILDFKRQLDKAGIELIVVPVPPKAVVYPDKIAGATRADEGNAVPRTDTAHQQFYDLLRKEGVNVLDLTDELIERRLDKQRPAYCQQDTHWSGAACVLAAKRVADELKKRPWYAGVAKQEYRNRSRQVQIGGDLWKALDGNKPRQELIELRFVGTGADLKPVKPDRASPVILLGDSHNLIFHAGKDMLAEGAGLPDQLALELGFPVDLIAVRGSGSTPARVNLLRQARAAPDYLAEKKVVIWCFGAREFTESTGWQKVPVVR